MMQLLRHVPAGYSHSFIFTMEILKVLRDDSQIGFFPADTWRNNNVITTSKRRCDFFYVIVSLS